MSQTETHEDEGPDPEDGPTRQTERRTISPLALLKEDFTHFKDEVRKVFKDPKTSQSERQVSPLTVLREDLNHLKDDLSSVFRINLTKERDHKEVPPSTFKIKVSEEPFKSLFRRDQKHVDGTKAPSEDDEEFRGQNEDNNNMKDSEDTEQEVNTEEETTKSFWEVCVPAAQRHQSDEPSGASSEESDRPSESRLWDVGRDKLREEPAENPWALKNFACYLTLDPNTANSELLLTAGNRKAKRVWSDQWPPDHPERFECCPQVLCREGLLDSVYWEVEWTGGADIGVTYNSISRDGDVGSCLLGHNAQSWSLECAEGSYTPCHGGKRFRSASPEPFTRRVGVYLNWSAGTLSFYCVSRDAMVHLHTFTSTFTEPLYPGFWVWAYGGCVSLSQVELDWERLLV